MEDKSMQMQLSINIYNPLPKSHKMPWRSLSDGRIDTALYGIFYVHNSYIIIGNYLLEKVIDASRRKMPYWPGLHDCLLIDHKAWNNPPHTCSLPRKIWVRKIYCENNKEFPLHEKYTLYLTHLSISFKWTFSLFHLMEAENVPHKQLGSDSLAF